MGALVVREIAIAVDLPTDMVSMHASLARFHICPASPNVELHANRLVLVFSKFDRTPIWDLDAPLALIFSSTLAFALL